MNTKICKKCNLEKSKNEFYSFKKKEKLYYRNYCKICHQDKKSITDKIYRETHKDEASILSKNHYRNNKTKILLRKKAYKKFRYHNDENYRLLTICRSRMNEILRKNVKLDKTINLLGCSINDLKKYLNQNFKERFGRDFDFDTELGYYQHHIDHIKPCSSFDLSDSEQQKQCFNYTNLQLLWHEENIKKGNNL